MSADTQFYALLVGIDHYRSRNVADLRGCVNDARAMYAFLTSRLGVPQDHIRLLTSSGDESPGNRSSRRNILDAWQELIGKLNPGDQLLFHYSGHGAQARSDDPVEPDGYDETLVPYDSRDVDESGQPVYDILDKELATLIALAEAQGALVTVFLDCCHSGSGTRDLPPVPVRRTVRDERPRPPHTLLPGTRTRRPAVTRAVHTRSGWKIGDGHVLLAGCRDEELSHEYRSPDTGAWHGATTYFLLQALRHYRPDMSWKEVHDAVQTRVKAVYPRQAPQLEGPGHRRVFGGLGAPSMAYLRVVDAEAEADGVLVRVDGGAAVGLTPGSRVEVYPPGSDDLRGAPLGTGEVVEAKVDHAYALLPGVSRDAIPVPSRAKVTALGYESLVYDVATDDPLIVEALSGEDASPFLNRVAADHEAARFRVVVENHRYVIQDGSGVRIVWESRPHTAEGAAQTAQNLHHLAVYNNVRVLRNPNPMPLLEEAVTVEALAYTRAGFHGPKDGEPLGDEGVLPPGRKLWLTVRNNSTEPLYVSVFNLSANYGIYRIYPERTSYQTLAGGRSISIRGMEMEVENPDADSSTEILKVFVTKDPTSFDVLEMPDLNEPEPRGQTRAIGPLAELLNGIRHDGSQSRKIVIRRDDTHERWITKQVEITVLKEPQARELDPGVQSVAVGTPLDISLEKPEAFSGQLIVSSLTQSTRGVEEPLALPPGLDNPEAAELFEPLSFTGTTRAVGASPGLLAIDAAPDQLDALSAANPLRLELSLEDEPDLEGVMPVAFDGEHYFLVGRQVEPHIGARDVNRRRLALEITGLPHPADAPDDGARAAGEVPTRDLKRTVRLFLYKVYRGELPPDTGVRKATPGTDGKPLYAPVTAADVAQAHKVALLVHGFSSSSEWLVQRAWPCLGPLDDYDLTLTYDYETFGTGIGENGRLLAEQMRALGFGPDDGVALDVFCHSMGSQVSRAFVELEGGHEYVDRVFMGGPPNAGTRLADAKELILWVGTILLNQAGLAPPTLIAEWFLKQIADNAAGVDDLRPGSELYRRLNGRTDPLDVQYYVQIGRNEAADGAVDWRRLFDKTELMRVFDKGLDQLLGPNDLLVGVESARSVRNGAWPGLLVVDVLPGNHFEYFWADASVEKLRAWMGGRG